MNFLYETCLIREHVGLEQRVKTNSLDHALITWANWIEEYGDETDTEIQFNKLLPDDGEFIMYYKNGEICRGEE